MVEHPNTSQPNPGPRPDTPPCRDFENWFDVKFRDKLNPKFSTISNKAHDHCISQAPSQCRQCIGSLCVLHCEHGTPTPNPNNISTQQWWWEGIRPFGDMSADCIFLPVHQLFSLPIHRDSVL